MEPQPDGSGPSLPFPIYRLLSRVEEYVLYDVDTISWIRREHRILGWLVGTLPQIPQQNVFLGLPLKLMPEEARLLTEKCLAYIVDDASRHHDLKGSSRPEELSFKDMLRAQGLEAAEAAARKKEAAREQAMQKGTAKRSQDTVESIGERESAIDKAEDSETLFQEVGSERQDSSRAELGMSGVAEPWYITPATSYRLLPTPNISTSNKLPDVSSSSFAIFKHLYEKGYYLSPGLRFGCQFMAYPGDPLRYHSHFLAVGADWDEEIDLLDTLGGGRLGTGVKKCFLLGGSQPQVRDTSMTRAFCIEWGGM